ncbi:MAG: hypothetical protein IKT60_03350 [Clostridia bacterium]|nr:hypothetical protein [Clostridia bacterium]
MEKKRKGSPVLQMLFAAVTGAVAGGAAAMPAAAVMQVFNLGESAMFPLVLVCAFLAGLVAGVVWGKLRGAAPLFSRVVVGVLTRGVMLLTGFLATGTVAFGMALIADTTAVIFGALLSGVFVRRQKSSSLDRIRQNPHRRSGNMRRT